MCEYERTYPFESGLNRGFFKNQMSTLTHSSTHNSVKQHRRAMEEVSKYAEDDRASYEFIRFSLNI